MKFQPTVIALLFCNACNVSIFISAEMENLLTSVTTDRNNIATDSGQTHVRKRKISSHNSRRLQTRPCTLVVKITNLGENQHSREVECYDTSTNEFLEISGETTQEELLASFDSNALTSNRSTLNGAYHSENGNLAISDGAVFGEVSSNMRTESPSLGVKTMLAVRIIAGNNVSPTSSAAVISDKWFGTSGDPVNLKSQYLKCSNGKLTCNPAELTTNDAPGVHTVTITETVGGKDDSVIREAALQKLQTELGSNLEQQFDHVMMCIPPGTNGNWIAYAYVNYYLSVYNDRWCDYVSGQMHEIGHNLNLGHSGEGTDAYDDRSGMMGYSYSRDNQLMCFNAPKNWQLGWYVDRQLTVSTEDVGWSGKIYGIADYDTTVDGDIVIVQIPGASSDTYDWYVSFNRQSGFNSDTNEGGNLVLIHRRDKGQGYSKSTLMSKMNGERTYAGAPLDITVNEINVSSNRPYASVTIGSLPIAPTNAPVAAPTEAPVTNRPTTSPPTDTPTSTPVAAPTEAPVTNRPTTSPPTDTPTNTPVAAPTEAPVTNPPTKSPTPLPTLSPTNSPTSSPQQEQCATGRYCCSRNFHDCVWGGKTESWCNSRQNLHWICKPQPGSCTRTHNDCRRKPCCDGLTCVYKNAWWSKCEYIAPTPTAPPVALPTAPPVPSPVNPPTGTCKSQWAQCKYGDPNSTCCGALKCKGSVWWSSCKY